MKQIEIHLNRLMEYIKNSNDRELFYLCLNLRNQINAKINQIEKAEQEK